MDEMSDEWQQREDAAVNRSRREEEDEMKCEITIDSEVR